MDAENVDPDLHLAACRIAVRCRNIAQLLMNENRCHEAQDHFYRIGKEVLEEFDKRPKREGDKP